MSSKIKSGNVSFDLKRFAGIKREYSKEDDQDWGSAGMNNVQEDSE